MGSIICLMGWMADRSYCAQNRSFVCVASLFHAETCQEAHFESCTIGQPCRGIERFGHRPIGKPNGQQYTSSRLRIVFAYGERSYVRHIKAEIPSRFFCLARLFVPDHSQRGGMRDLFLDRSLQVFLPAAIGLQSTKRYSIFRKREKWIQCKAMTFEMYLRGQNGRTRIPLSSY